VADSIMLAPGLLSTMTWVPAISVRRRATDAPGQSSEPPAASPTTSRMAGRPCGQGVCASAASGPTAAAPASQAPKLRREMRE
jgi:hypothetical protein